MKKYFLKPIAFKLALSFVLILVAIVIHSCRKDSKSDAQSSPAVTAAKSWYESAYPVNNSVNSKLITQSTGGNHDLSQRIKPDWQHTISYIRNNKNVIEMPVDPGAKFASTFKIGNKSLNKAYSRSYYLLMNDGKKYEAYILTIVADSAYVKNDLSKLTHNTYRKHDADFSGVALYFTPKGNYLGGYAYKDGQLIAPATTTQQTGSQHIQSVNNNKLRPEAIVQVCTDWYIAYFTDGVFQDADYLGTTCKNVDDGNPSNTGGNSSPPPPPPCPPGSHTGPPVIHPCTVPVESAINDGHLTVNNLPAPPPDGGVPPPPAQTPCIVDAPPQPCATMDPCSQGKLLSNNTDFRNKMTSLNDSISKPHESAYKLNADGSSVALNGGVSGTSFNFTASFFANSTGFIHNHENNPNNLSIFSADDFRTLFLAVSATAANHQANYTFGLVTAKGTTYLLSINDLGKFKSFASNLFSPGNPNQLNTFNNLYNLYVNSSNTPDQNEQGFTTLMTFLTNGGSDPGLTLMKGNTSSFSGWVKVVNTNGTIQYVNCN
ncbi:MAG: hypothetical protein H0X33_13515 [Taibaiella sp.]|nr:hypothetical protein [Taibaiella sp.]